ncbi:MULTISPECIES: nuclear transport factor 2 family protein [unclassified Pedobacter]|uniref:nuclear transport factor 2 family protein n=1 Tax=Pedobacter TaxID=84567 RepID=UPI000B4AB31A|nr:MULTISPECIES: nuclear transport factor 2 family protein [unclassified Pedobacter]MCX2431658.1 nuclear transport factor 2 family protein [Pedobacter sp. GR22-10]MCX2582205.1 nuclear transport factor 2 family protein [Pedobacter sp. MR22-3]OWK72371.1 hypothetical protein CBW18_02085 [Pedobacter sp. AJM]
MTSENTTGHQILLSLLSAFNQDTATVLSLFDPKATVEYPYAKSLGSAYQLTMDDYRKHLDHILGDMPDIIFTALNVYPLKEPDSYWAEFHGETTVPATGALYQQDYVVNFRLENGKFIYYKEYWNVLPVLSTLMRKEQAQQIIDKHIY